MKFCWKFYETIKFHYEAKRKANNSHSRRCFSHNSQANNAHILLDIFYVAIMQWGQIYFHDSKQSYQWYLLTFGTILVSSFKKIFIGLLHKFLSSKPVVKQNPRIKIVVLWVLNSLTYCPRFRYIQSVRKSLAWTLCGILEMQESRFSLIFIAQWNLW